MASQILLDRFQKFQLPENLYWQSERLRHQEEDARRGLNFTKSAEEFRRVRVENELYLVRMKRQQQLIWLMSGGFPACRRIDDRLSAGEASPDAD